MGEQTKRTGLTDIPYIDLPNNSISQEVNVNSGTIGGVRIAPVQQQAGVGSNAIGQVAEKGNEYFFVGSAVNAIALLGQLKQKTGLDQYGIWIGETGQYLKYTIADGLVIHGGGIQAGNIHIPDKDTTSDSLHVDSIGNLWIGCTQTQFLANPKNAKAYILANGDAYFSNAEITGSLHIPDRDTTKDSLHIDTNGNLYIGCTESEFIGSPDSAKASILNTGNANFKNATIGGTLKTTVFQKDVVSAIGGQLIVSNSDVLEVDMSELDNSKLTIKGTTTFAVNSILLMKDGINEEWLRITDISTAPEYTVVRDLANAYSADDNPKWPKGTAVVAMGLSNGVGSYSGGWLRLFGAGTNSPYYSVYARSGVDYDDYKEVCRLGNLKGIAGKASDCYGLFLGDFDNKKYLVYDNVSNEFELSGNIKPIIYKTAGRDLKAGRMVRGAINGFGRVWYANDFTNDSVQLFLGVCMADTAKGSIAPIQVLGEAVVSGVGEGFAYYPYTHIDAQMDWDDTNLTITNNYSYAQTFTTGPSTDGFCIVDAVDLKFTIGGNATGLVSIYNTSGGIPTDQIGGLGEMDTPIYPTTGVQSLVFERPVQLALNTMYAIVYKPNSGYLSGTNYLRYRNSNYYSGGTMLIHNGTSWTNYPTRDMFFKARYSRGLINYNPGLTTYKVGVGSGSNRLLIKG